MPPWEATVAFDSNLFSLVTPVWLTFLGSGTFGIHELALTAPSTRPSQPLRR